MYVSTELLLWLHFVALAIGAGSGVALSQVGPRLIALPPDQRSHLWPLELFFSRTGLIGLVVLLCTGPAMMWLRFGGFSGMNRWFWAKMILVLIAVLGISLHEYGIKRFRRGDEAAARLMLISGRMTGATMVLVVLCAVFAFN